MANQHVVRRGKKWGVRGQGNSRDTTHHGTQQEAFEAAREIAQNKGGDVFIHDRQGQFRERNTYGKKDPRSSKG